MYNRTYQPLLLDTIKVPAPDNYFKDVGENEKSENADRLAIPLFFGNETFGLLDLEVSGGTRLDGKFIAICRTFSKRIAENLEQDLKKAQDEVASEITPDTEEITPYQVCTTSCLYNHFVVLRNDAVEAVWDISLQGKIQ